MFADNGEGTKSTGCFLAEGIASNWQQRNILTFCAMRGKHGSYMGEEVKNMIVARGKNGQNNDT